MRAAGKGPPTLRWLRNTLRFYGLLLLPGGSSLPRPGEEPVLLVHSWGISLV